MNRFEKKKIIDVYCGTSFVCIRRPLCLVVAVASWEFKILSV